VRCARIDAGADGADGPWGSSLFHARGPARLPATGCAKAEAVPVVGRRDAVARTPLPTARRSATISCEN
jgi:hypothetical protein